MQEALSVAMKFDDIENALHSRRDRQEIIELAKQDWPEIWLANAANVRKLEAAQSAIAQRAAELRAKTSDGFELGSEYDELVRRMQVDTKRIQVLRLGLEQLTIIQNQLSTAEFALSGMRVVADAVQDLNKALSQPMRHSDHKPVSKPKTLPVHSLQPSQDLTVIITRRKKELDDLLREYERRRTARHRAELARAGYVDGQIARDSEIEALKAEARIQRAATIQEIASGGMAEALRRAINRQSAKLYATIWAPGPGATFSLDDQQTIETEEMKRVWDYCQEQSKGSIGVSGPRGIGKTTLVDRVIARAREKDGYLGVSLFAPSDFDPRDFVLHAYAELCKSVGGADELHESDDRPADPDKSAARPSKFSFQQWMTFLLASAVLLPLSYILCFQISPYVGYLWISYGTAGILLVVGLPFRDFRPANIVALIGSAAALSATLFLTALTQSQRSLVVLTIAALSIVVSMYLETRRGASLRSFESLISQRESQMPVSEKAFAVSLFMALLVSLASSFFVHPFRVVFAVMLGALGALAFRVLLHQLISHSATRYGLPTSMPRRRRIIDPRGSTSAVRHSPVNFQTPGTSIERPLTEKPNGKEVEDGDEYKRSDARSFVSAPTPPRGVRLQEDLKRIASNRLAGIRYQQSIAFTDGVKVGGSVKLGALTVSADTNSGVNSSFARRLQNFPEIVGEFRDFLKLVAVNYKILITVDELDKMNPEGALSFLNGFKSIFGIRGVYFLVSVSEDAAIEFERSGTPFKSVYDSAFDEVVRVPSLDYKTASSIVDGQVIGLPRPFVLLGFILSGGLPRDLLRILRLFEQRGRRGEVFLGALSEEMIVRHLAARRKAVVFDAGRTMGSTEVSDLSGIIDVLLKIDLGKPPRENVETLRELIGLSSTGSDPIVRTLEEYCAILEFSAVTLELFKLSEGEDFRRCEQPELAQCLQDFIGAPALAAVSPKASISASLRFATGVGLPSLWSCEALVQRAPLSTPALRNGRSIIDAQNTPDEVESAS